MKGKLIRAMLGAVAVAAGALCAAQAMGQAKPGVFAEEDKDRGVPPTRQLRTPAIIRRRHFRYPAARS